MNIYTGKDGYNSAQLWAERSRSALDERGTLYAYDVRGTESPNAKENADWIKTELAKHSWPPAVLEIGSGFGKWAGELRGQYSEFVGAEIIPERVRHARELYAGEPVSFYRIENPTWDIGIKFPVVLVITVIQHLLVPDAIDVLQGVARHLQPGGVALIIDDCIFPGMEEAEANQRYGSACAAHMIPKPLSILQAAAPELTWEQKGNNKFVVRPA